jgi:hypothetical protein
MATIDYVRRTDPIQYLSLLWSGTGRSFPRLQVSRLDLRFSLEREFTIYIESRDAPSRSPRSIRPTLLSVVYTDVSRAQHGTAAAEREELPHW